MEHVKGIKTFLRKKKTKSTICSREQHRNLSEKEKEKKHPYGCERYKKNMKEYRKK